MTGVGEKAAHVRQRMREGSTGNHACHWPGCERKVPPAQWGCREHWYKLPLELRREVWRTYRIGQEDSKTPSASYIAVAKRVQKWILERENKR